MAQALGIQRPDLLHAPAIQLCAHARAQAPARQIEPHALMLCRAAAALGTGQQGIEQRTQQTHIPGIARAYGFLQRLAQLAHLLGRHLPSLVAENVIYQINSCLRMFFLTLIWFSI